LRIRFYQSLIGQEHLVILEQKKKDGRITGFTDNYAEVVLPWKPGLEHKAVRVRIESLQGDFLTGSIIPSNT
jgi:tRNA A37 methylthiotransferase MiaB